MSKVQFDVVIVGGGMVGLAAASLLSQSALNIAVIEAHPPELEWDNQAYALRVSAINRASEKILQQAGVWDAMCDMGISPYDKMHVWDEGSQGVIDFNSREIGEYNLGHIIENRVIQKALWQSLQPADQVHFFCPNKLLSITKQTDHWALMLDSGRTIETPLVIAADGANSWVRAQVDIESHMIPYEHTAIVTTVKCEKPHNQTAAQRFLYTGPLALLPLVDSNTCSVVWSVESEEAKRLLALSDTGFNEALTGAFDAYFGGVETIAKRMSFPLIKRHASTYVLPGLALIGDAAHTIHPLAGQGVNLGFLDAKSLSDIIVAAHAKGRDYATLSNLQKYERAQRGYNTAVQTLMSGFKNLFSNDAQILGIMRGCGLNVANQVKPLKHFLMHKALGS